MPDAFPVRALVFDVFGTVVDWQSGVARDLEALLAPKGYTLDWTAFANAWRMQYRPAMEAVRSGQRSYVKMDQLHLEMLEPALSEFGVTGLTDAEKFELSRAWRRLDPWPDVVSGLTRLKSGYIIAALSNANISLAVSMAKRAGLPWDLILGAELVQTYKPMPVVYDSAPAILDLDPSQVMMVACHVWDLEAAAARGLRTAFVERPDEYGPGAGSPLPKPGEFDIAAASFIDLAYQLGC